MSPHAGPRSPSEPGPRRIEGLRGAAHLAADVVRDLCSLAQPGMSPASIDRVARRIILERGAVPTFPSMPMDGAPFGHSAIVARGCDAVLARPTDELLRHGEVVTIDLGLVLDGWCADVARCTAVGVPAGSDSRACRLARASERVSMAAARACVVGALWRDVQDAIGREIEAACAEGLAVELVSGFGAHEIGREPHEGRALPFEQRPFVTTAARARDRAGPRWTQPAERVLLRDGMVLCVEPVVREADRSDPWQAWTERTVLVGRSSTLLDAERVEASEIVRAEAGPESGAGA